MHRVPTANESHNPTWFHETVPEPRIALARQTDILSAHQWLAIESAFADAGGLIGVDELTALIRKECKLEELLVASPPASLVARWIAFKKVVTINSPWGHMLPLFQFDFPRAAIHTGVQLAVNEFKGVLSDVELALWFVTPNDWLGGQKPLQAMKTNVAAVQQAACTDRFVALGD